MRRNPRGRPKQEASASSPRIPTVWSDREMNDDRYLVLTHGQLGPLTSKTANSAVRYLPERVVGVLDESRAGRTGQDVLGFGGPVMLRPGSTRSVKEAQSYSRGREGVLRSAIPPSCRRC